MADVTTDLLTDDELIAVRAELVREAEELAADLQASSSEVAGLISDSGDGSGDDLADAGSKAFEREQGMYLAGQLAETLEQVQRAIARVDAGTYGVCETCGGPIGRLRLEVFPRATQCMSCKVAQGG